MRVMQNYGSFNELVAGQAQIHSRMGDFNVPICTENAQFWQNGQKIDVGSHPDRQWMEKVNELEQQVSVIFTVHYFIREHMTKSSREHIIRQIMFDNNFKQAIREHVAQLKEISDNLYASCDIKVESDISWLNQIIND